MLDGALRSWRNLITVFKNKNANRTILNTINQLDNKLEKETEKYKIDTELYKLGFIENELRDIEQLKQTIIKQLNERTKSNQSLLLTSVRGQRISLSESTSYTHRVSSGTTISLERFRTTRISPAIFLSSFFCPSLSASPLDFPEATNRERRTPLHIACREDNLPVVQYLCEVAKVNTEEAYEKANSKEIKEYLNKYLSK